MSSNEKCERKDKLLINKIPVGPGEVDERISIFVDIEHVGDDISHHDGYQVDFYGLSQTGTYINCVNLFKKDEKSLADELVSTILPGTTWYITGDPLFTESLGRTVIFDCEYQAYDPSKINLEFNTKKSSRHIESRSEIDQFPGHKHSYLNPHKGFFMKESVNYKKSDLDQLIKETKEDVKEYLWKIFAYHSARPESVVGWLTMLNKISKSYFCYNMVEDNQVHYDRDQLYEMLTVSLFGDIKAIQRMIDNYARSGFPIVYVSKESHEKLKTLSNKFVDSILEGVFFKIFSVTEEELLL